MDRGTFEGHVKFKKATAKWLATQTPRSQNVAAYEAAIARAKQRTKQQEQVAAQHSGEQPSDDVLIRFADEDEWELARDLAFRTYEEFNEGDYSAEGKHSFQGFLFDPRLKEMFVDGQMRLFVAEYDDEIIGMIGLKYDRHISLLFVEGACHRQGIGGALVRVVAQYADRLGQRSLTVHSSLYAREFYHSMGFRDTGLQAMEGGIRYVPMALQLPARL